jgi:hypothetical protein
MMQILLKCVAPDFVDDPTHAVVELTPALTHYIWDRIQLAKKLKAEDRDFLGLRFDDYSPEFMDFGPADLDVVCKMLSRPDKEYLEEDFDSDMDAGCLILPLQLSPETLKPEPGFKPANYTGMRPCILHVDDTHFYWVACHKHGGMGSRVETNSCTETELREWAEDFLGMELDP